MPEAKTARLTKTERLSLLARLQEAERKYKTGDVDQKIADPDNPSRPRWAFEEELNELSKYEAYLREEIPSWYFKLVAIRAEAKDYFDTATHGDRLDLYLMAQELYRQLPEHVAPDDTAEESEERKTVKNTIRVIVAGLEYLHATSDFTSAITYAQSLNEYIIESGLVTKENPAYGTRAVISYFLGRSHRQRGIDDDYQQAIDYFYQCSEFYFEMARRRGNLREDVIYARTRAMVSLAFGAGFLFYNAQSDLPRAKALTAQARLAFLKEDGDDDDRVCCKLHYYYLALLHASILRAEAGEVAWDQAGERTRDEGERTDAEEKLRSALDLLEEGETWLQWKPKYYIHVLYNKALIYLYQGPTSYDRARECITKLIQKCQDNPRWLANALILKSHLERRAGNVDGALADAMRAYNQAGSHLPVRIEALLARGQAQMERNNLVGARDDFEKSFELNNGANKKFDAMALVLLVRMALAQQRPQLAREKFAQLKSIIPSIKHGFILSKYRELESELGNYRADFVIPADVEDLDYEKHETELRRWLLEKSLREDGNLSKVAERLNVSKKTIYQWRDKLIG